MNCFMKTIRCVNISLTHYFLFECHGHAPVEIIQLIMQALADSLQISIFYCDSTNKYHMIMNKNVYGILYEHRECHQLYKVAHMENVKKMAYDNHKIYFINHNNELYSKSSDESCRGIATKKMDNVVDINYSGYLYILRTDKKLIRIEDKKGKILMHHVDTFDCYGDYIAVVSKNKCYISRNHRFRYININDNIVSIKMSRVEVYALSINGVVYTYNYYDKIINTLTLPQIIKIDNFKYGLVCLDINHHAHLYGVVDDKLINEPKSIKLNNIIDVKCTDNAMMFLTADLRVHLLNNALNTTIRPIFSFV